MGSPMENPTNTAKLPPAAAATRPQRWSARRKQEIVLRLLRGEPIEAIARELAIEPYRLECWRDRALSGMAAGLKERWSRAAAASEWVAKEIAYALARKAGNKDQLPEIQPVPIEGPPPPPPPDSLQHLHFNDALLLAHIQAA